MKTDDLISLLATNEPVVDADLPLRRYRHALGLGLSGAGALMLTFLGLREDLVEATALPMFWLKAAVPLLLLVAAVAGALRLGRPGMRLGAVPAVAALPVVAIWILGVYALAGASQEARGDLVLGASWAVCPLYITMLSVPMFVGASWAMRGLAPTRLGLAGACVGLLAGSAGALVYCLHCPEMAAPFIGTWYLLGIAIPTLAGVIAVPRMLAW